MCWLANAVQLNPALAIASAVSIKFRLENMEQFYLISNIFVGLFLILQVGSFLNRKQKIIRHKQEILILRNFKCIDYVYIILGLALIGISILAVKLNRNLEHFIFWSLLGIGNILNGLLNKGEYLLLNAEGIKTRKLKWDLITKTRLNEINNTEIIFETKTKNIIIDFYTAEKIIEFKNTVKRVSPTTYEIYLDEIK